MTKILSDLPGGVYIQVRDKEEYQAKFANVKAQNELGLKLLDDNEGN
jgi:hypothetical protein